ncbi:MAG: acyltransferase [Treponema sp.]|nr:acyltransferase [Treponema sp.]
MSVLLDLFQLATDFIMNSPFLIIRRLYLSIFARIGTGCFIARKCDVRFPKHLIIGNNSVINKLCTVDCRGGTIIIEDNVDIAQQVNIWTLEHDISSPTHSTKGGDVIIEHHCWISSRATVLPGVHIGYGAVVEKAFLKKKRYFNEVVKK